jgi:23S rRNA (pseudouridine1915-N3)-methyltransferase
MRITVAAVGRPRDAALAAAIRDYETRAARYWPLEFVEVRAEGGAGRSPDQIRDREGERLRAAVPAGADVWLCDREGVARTSEAFAAWLQQRRERARDIAVVIGGAFGLGQSIRDTARGSLSLGPMTFAHEIARLVLAEQLYRAGTIVRGEPYHKS